MQRHASLPHSQRRLQQPHHQRAPVLQALHHQPAQRQAQARPSLLCIRSGGAAAAASFSGRGSIASGPHRRWDPQQGAPRGEAQVAKAALSAADGSGGNTAGEPEASWGKRVANFTDAFWKFLRPHTIRGTVLGTTAVTTRALLETPELIDWGLLPKALMGLLALLCGNGYIVGINQIYDVDIDVVNKPFLPIAAGQLSPGLAWVLCLLLASAGVGIVATHYGKLITSLYTFGLALGTVYSVPPLRLKRFAVPAFLIIACVRGFLLNFGVYNATKAAIGAPASWSPAISFITLFVTLFAVVIAVTKDLPDVEGDLANGIETFATRLGVPAVSMGAVSLLLLNYGGAIWMALQPQLGFNPWVMAGGHAVLALALTWRAAVLHQQKYTRDAIQTFYQWIWTLFYSEYALFPFL